MHSSARNSFIRGFTLVELLVVITIIAILSVIGVTVFTGIQKSARDTKKKSDVESIIKAYEVRYASTGSYGTTLIEGTAFASGSVPTPPEGGSYDVMLDNSTGGIKVCSPLADGSSFCQGSIQEQAPTDTTNVTYLSGGPGGGGGPAPSSSPTASPTSTPAPTATPAPLPSDIANCVIWIKADTGVSKNGADKVSGWSNQCSTVNFTQVNGGRQPSYIANAVNGKPVIRFDGSDDYIYAGSSGMTIGTGFFVVGWKGGLPTSLNYPGPGALDNNAAGTIDNGNNQLGAFGSFVKNTKNFSGASLSPGNPQVQNGFFRFLQNGTPVSGVTNILLGVRDNSGAYWNGDIAEVIIYSRTLTTTEIQTITTYLSTKYGI